MHVSMCENTLEISVWASLLFIVGEAESDLVTSPPEGDTGHMVTV